MKHCDAIERYVSGLDSSGDAHPSEELLSHVAECEHCRQELHQIHHAAVGMLLHRFDSPGSDEHLSDLDMAAFAAHGLDAPNADQAVEHLSRCRECREQFTQVRRVIEQHEDLIDSPESPPSADRSVPGQLRMIFGDVGRLGRALGSFVAWVAEWAVLLVVLFQISAAYLANSNEIGRSAATEFLGIVPRHELRLWVIAAACIALAFVFRWIGDQLYQSAVGRQDRR